MTKSNQLIKTPTGVVDSSTGEIIENTKITPHSLVNTNEDIKYDSTWLNNELVNQIQLLKSDSSLVTKIQLYEKLNYSKDKFDYWMRKNGDKPRTKDLQRKLNEILEARLVSMGFTIKGYGYVIFLLKNNHGYQDSKTIDNNTQVTFNVNRGISTPKRKQVTVQVQR